MKQYHEIAVIKDGNEHVGFIIKGGTAEDSSHDYGFVNKETFEKMAEQGYIQFFTYDKSQKRVVVDYTKEELAYLKKIHAKPLKGKDYWSNDISVRVDDFNKTGSCVLIKTLAMSSAAKEVVMSLWFVSQNVSAIKFVKDALTAYCKTFPMAGRFTFSFKGNNNWFNYTMLLSLWVEFFNTLYDHGTGVAENILLFDNSTIKDFRKHTKEVRDVSTSSIRKFLINATIPSDTQCERAFKAFEDLRKRSKA